MRVIHAPDQARRRRRPFLRDLQALAAHEERNHRGGDVILLDDGQLTIEDALREVADAAT